MLKCNPEYIINVVNMRITLLKSKIIDKKSVQIPENQFEYLEESIMSKDRALKILLKEILKIKQKNKDIIKANLDKHNYIPEEFRK